MNSAEELWQGYDEQALPTKPITKEESADGALHGSVHLWVWRRVPAGVEVLLQQRQNDRLTWPGYWDMAAAGHIDAGEDPLTAALRETNEEIGLAVEPSDLKLMFVQRVNLDYGPTDIKEREIQWVYAAEFPTDAHLSIQSDEVAATQWVTLRGLSDFIEGKALPGQAADSRMIPHGTAYFAAVFEGLGLLSA